VKDWCEAAEKGIYAVLARSNFYGQVRPLIYYSCLYGHDAMLPQKHHENGRLVFHTVSPAELYLDTNEYDQVETVYRVFTMKLDEAAEFFGLDKLHPEIRRDYEAAKSSRIHREMRKEVQIIHAVYRRKERDETSATKGNMPFASVYVDAVNKHLIEESGYKDFPYAVFVWDKKIGTAYGISPAYEALDTARAFDFLKEAELDMADISAHPPVNIPDGERGIDPMRPGGKFWYKEGSGMVAPIGAGLNFPITLEVMREYEKSLRDVLDVDFFLSLMTEGPARTATEVMERKSEKIGTLSFLVENLEAALAKVVQTVFDMMAEAGELPPLAPALQNIDRQVGLKMECVGPLSQIQQSYYDEQGISKTVQLIGSIAQISQAVPALGAALDFVDGDALVKRGMETAGAAQTMIREDDDVAAMRQQRAEAQAAAAQAQQAMQQQAMVMQNFNKLNQPTQPGSLAAAMDNMNQGGQG
jgi:hypothetical protein